MYVLIHCRISRISRPFLVSSLLDVVVFPDASIRTDTGDDVLEEYKNDNDLLS